MSLYRIQDGEDLFSPRRYKHGDQSRNYHRSVRIKKKSPHRKYFIDAKYPDGHFTDVYDSDLYYKENYGVHRNAGIKYDLSDETLRYGGGDYKLYRTKHYNVAYTTVPKQSKRDRYHPSGRYNKSILFYEENHPTYYRKDTRSNQTMPNYVNNESFSPLRNVYNHSHAQTSASSYDRLDSNMTQTITAEQTWNLPIPPSQITNHDEQLFNQRSIRSSGDDVKTEVFEHRSCSANVITLEEGGSQGISVHNPPHKTSISKGEKAVISSSESSEQLYAMINQKSEFESSETQSMTASFEDSVFESTNGNSTSQLTGPIKNAYSVPVTMIEIPESEHSFGNASKTKSDKFAAKTHERSEEISKENDENLIEKLLKKGSEKTEMVEAKLAFSSEKLKKNLREVVENIMQQRVHKTGEKDETDHWDEKDPKEIEQYLSKRRPTLSEWMTDSANIRRRQSSSTSSRLGGSVDATDKERKAGSTEQGRNRKVSFQLKKDKNNKEDVHEDDDHHEVCPWGRIKKCGNRESHKELKDRIKNRTAFLTPTYANFQSEHDVDLDMNKLNHNSICFIARNFENKDNHDTSKDCKSGNYLRIYCDDCDKFQSENCSEDDF